MKASSKILFNRQLLYLTVGKTPTVRNKSTEHNPPFWKKYDSDQEFQDIKQQVKNIFLVKYLLVNKLQE